MRNLTANEVTQANGGKCHYDPAIEEALQNFLDQLSTLGLLGSSVEENGRAEIISHAAWVVCDK